MTRREFLAAVAVATAGCSQNRPVPPSNNLVTVPLWIRANRCWDLDDISSQLVMTNKAFASANMRFQILYQEEASDPKDWDTVCREAYGIAHEKKALCVHLVSRLMENGQEYAGLSNYPSNFPGSIFQWGTAVSINCTADTLAHELGHAFNLMHNWEDDLSETISQSEPGCEDVNNLMSYCRNDRPGILLPQQVDLARAWAVSSPRDLVTQYDKSVVTMRRRMTYTNNVRPVE